MVLTFNDMFMTIAVLAVVALALVPFLKEASPTTPIDSH
jgi:hypothetical protein